MVNHGKLQRYLQWVFGKQLLEVITDLLPLEEAVQQQQVR
jgi:hypothetical protein